MTQSLADMRRDYARDGLTEAQAPDEPFALFINGLPRRSKPSRHLLRPMR